MKLVPTSLFGRLFALSLLATLAALIVAGVAIGGVMQRFVMASIDARLSDRLTALESAVRADGSVDHAQLDRVTARIADDEPWRIDMPNGGIIGSGDLVANDDRHRPPPPPGGPRRPGPALFGAPFEAQLLSGERVHGLTTTMPVVSGAARVSVAVRRREIDRPVMTALAPLAASLAILGVALGGAALIQLRIGLRPLRDLHRAVEAIRRGHAMSVPETIPDELAPLARELNALATDTSTALASARNSAANLAHALKTPVATLALHLRGDAVAEAQLARVDATLRHHLGRARAAAADRRAETLLAPALADLAATIEELHMGRIVIHIGVPADLSAAMGAQDFDELAGNLIDNAARHARTRVSVDAHPDGRLVWLTVADDGAGIPTGDRARATKPGTRLDERGDGHGFGLTIVQELAELHGGTLMLDDAPGGGLLAKVSLQRAR